MGTTKVEEISKKVQESMLKWYGHVMRKGICRERVTRTDVEGRRRKGRPKQRWMDSVNVDMREKGLSGEQTHNLYVSHTSIPHYIEVGKMR